MFLLDVSGVPYLIVLFLQISNISNKRHSSMPTKTHGKNITGKK